ncbi:MAG: hypothetical protein QOE79_783 [Sphingomonadales bacterium]|jgi:hypothetical protein|nr:hypothetical protein [Sphingomonadales bacterium]MEA3050673.1 hypothetical protein [Sphingomonadales bacterium]
MGKRTKLFCSLAVASVFVSLSPASAQSTNIAYHTTFYSDATHTTEVGALWWTGCDRWNNPTYRLYGTNTNYNEEEEAGYCVDGEPQPL